MRIGMLTACYDPVVNGVTQMIALYDRHLSAAGHRVTIFTLGAPPPGEDSSKVIRSPAVPLGKTGYYFGIRYDHEAQKRLKEVDVLHSHHLLMGLEFAGRYVTKPVIFTNHTRYDIYLSAYGRLPATVANSIMQQAWPRLTNIADAVIAPSASIERIMRNSGVRTPIELIENGVEVEQFRRPTIGNARSEAGIPAAATVFTYVGRLSREKNIRRLVDEFAIAVGQSDNLYLLLVGAGPMEAKLRRQAGNLGLNRRIILCGQVQPERVPALLAISDAFVSASVSEVHPLAVIEAMAAGTPVIAFDSPGIADIVTHDRTGLLADGTPGSLAAAMRRLAGSGEMRHRLAAGARSAGQRYDIRFTVKRTLSLYRRLIESRRLRAADVTTNLGDDLEKQRSPEARRAAFRVAAGAGGKGAREQ
ncbi:MAG: glycosyltransferase [Chloroflexota bacterium]|nr:MAG: glycosyltransferase [Chloroflexota bacterium]